MLPFEKNKYKIALVSILSIALILRIVQTIVHPFGQAGHYGFPFTTLVYKLAEIFFGGSYPDISLAARNIVSTFFEIMAIYYTYKLAALYDKNVGIIAAFILAVNPLYTGAIVYIEAPIITGLACAYLYYIIKAVDAGNLKYYLLGYVFMTFSFFTKILEGLIPFPALIFYFMFKNLNVQKKATDNKSRLFSAANIFHGLLHKNVIYPVIVGLITVLTGSVWFLITGQLRGFLAPSAGHFTGPFDYGIDLAILLRALFFIKVYFLHATAFGSLLIIFLYGLLKNAKHAREIPFYGFVIIWFLMIPIVFSVLYPSGKTVYSSPPLTFYFWTYYPFPLYHYLATFPAFSIIAGMALYELYKEKGKYFITVNALNVALAVYLWSKYVVLPFEYGVLGAIISGFSIILLYPVLNSEFGAKLENKLRIQNLYWKVIFFAYFPILLFFAIKINVLKYI